MHRYKLPFSELAKKDLVGVSLMDVLDQLLKEIGVRRTTEATKKGVWRDGTGKREREREREREADYAPGGRGYREESRASVRE